MTAAAHRHLLFGLLALQNGLIDQGQLILAFEAWTRDKARSPADQLVARGDLDADACAGLEAIVASHVKKHGDVEKSLAAVPADRSTCDRLAALGEPEIESTITRVTRNSGGQATTTYAHSDRTSTLAVGGSTSDGQRFRLLRPHARGGLGEVFVALDAELHREVALKQILDRHADDPGSRRRFVVEAEITGALEHPGVVPVYGLGTYAGGRPYYAMRFIRGDSLKEGIEHFHGDETLQSHPGRRSLELRKLLRRFLDVCNAVDYAHSRGVIHRDLKPANIVLGQHGETLVVDWGLAKVVGQADPSSGEQPIAPSSSGSSETLPGSVLGTPAYMSPEQASGDLDRLGPRSDVYSLGATLYCLLIGRAPFEGGDVVAVLRQVRAGDFRAPREVDPSLDKALEAVCLKAMATTTQDRYAGCRALAEDVERWAADEPVSAYHEPLARRARRWAKRNRTIVATAVVALLAGVVGLFAVAVVQTQARTALADANTKVQARYELALEAIQAFHTGVSEDFLLKQNQFKAQRDGLLRSAAHFYGRLSALLDKGTDAASRRALADSNFELADLTNKVGDKEAALSAHRAVLAARQALAAEPGSGSGILVDVGKSLAAMAEIHDLMGKTDEAVAGYRRSESLLAVPAASDPVVRAALANCRSRLGYFLNRTGRNAEALAAFRLARAEQEVLAAGPDASIKARRDLATTVELMAALLMESGKLTETETEFRTVLAIRQGLVHDNPAVTEFRHDLQRIHNRLGVMFSQMGKRSEEEAEYRASLAILQKLADENPAVTEFRRTLAIGHNNLGLRLWRDARLSEAEAEFRTALAIRQELVHDNPAAIQYRHGLGLSHQSLGLVLRDLARPAEAESQLRTAVALLQKLADDNPSVVEFRSHLGMAHRLLGGVLQATGTPSQAEAEFREALALEQKIADDNPTNIMLRWDLGAAHTELGLQLARGKRFPEAFTALDTGRSIFQKLVDADPQNAAYLKDLGQSYADHGRIRVLAGQPALAVPDLRRALEIWAKVASPVPDTRFERVRVLALLAGLGQAPESGVTAAEGAAFANQAVAALRDAINSGWAMRDDLKAPDFDPLRGREDFKKLVAELEAKLGPKAKPVDGSLPAAADPSTKGR
jgi:tetratricopeptide (TPR) repeat protein/tRNA A-37 threonylcarbamoyl transferase component Bud32